MRYRELEPISKQLTIVIGLTVVGFMAFGLALSYYRNFIFEQTLIEIADQNQKLADTIGQSQSDLDYYRSAQYKDKFAKENLGKVSAGEKILIITQEPELPDLALHANPNITEEQELAYQEKLRQLPMIQHWKLYLFEREKIDELKRGL